MKKLLLLIMLFSLSCMSRAEREKWEVRQEKKFSGACSLKLSNLYPSSNIKEGNWMRRGEWRTRLYLLESRVFECKQTEQFLPYEVKITPLTFTE